ncbi:MAG TPA: FAD-dependent oxidoreductase, partial [Bryobacteraceae bacterium]|nr:FAD-dependent oxidoreductase [Bryobacteraceae bacterium]
MTPPAKYAARLPDFDFWKAMVPCQEACPIHTDAGRYVQLIAQGQYEQAYLTSRSPNPFASVCGRVCAAPCEDKCRRGSIDAPVSIRALKRFVTEKFGVESLAPDTQDKLIQISTEPGNKTPWHLPMLRISRAGVAKGEKVAVVGGGPAGLACAHDLALMGYAVTVFEASERAGGMMFHGIPEFRLSRPVIDKEIDKILKLGVQVKLNAPLTEKFGLRDLRAQGYQAVFLSVGTQRGRDMAIEGSDLDGVVRAIDFLLNVNHGYRVSLGKRVVVIGGGFVAFDAARMALRQALEGEEDRGGESMKAALDAARSAVRAGVADVKMISLESFAEMPVMRTAQGREEFEEARKEGIRFITQRGARRLAGADGRLQAIDLIGVKRTYDENGRFKPVYDSAVAETIEADTVILAIGQQAELSFLRAEDGVELTPQRTVKVNRTTLATSAAGVFAGGDVAFGPRNLIEAIANGKTAALSIDNYLRGAAIEPEARLWIDKIPTRAYSITADYEKFGREAPETVDLQRRTGISEVELGYTEPEARRQAERCLRCHIQTIYDAEKCVLCNRCVDICPEYCLKLVPLDQLDWDDDTMARAKEFYGADEFEPLSAMIKDDEKCIRCGLCAVRCPTDAMTMEIFFYEESD